MFTPNRKYEEVVTPAKAAKYLEENSFPRQRNLSRKRVRELTKEASKGKYVPEHVAIAFAILPDGTRYLVDGQHRTTFILETGKTIKLSVHEYHVADMENAGLLYNTFDPRGSTRSKRDNARAAGVDEIEGLQRGDISPGLKAVEAIVKGCFFNPSEANVSVDAEIVVDEMNNFVDEISLYMNIVKRCKKENPTLSKQLQTAGVMSLGLIMLRDNKDLAIDFWENAALRNPTNRLPNKRYSNCQILSEWLVKPVKDYKLGPEAQLHTATAVSTLWNSYYQNKMVQRYRRPSEEKMKERSKTTPIHLDGCNI